MAFKKTKTIYESENVKVFINQCHNKGKKTKLFSVRKDDKRGYGELLGLIKFNGAWRQYCFYPEEETFWSAGCLSGITDFISKLNKELRKSWNERR